MFLKQYYLNCLAHASYMIADEQTKIAAVIDPQRDVEQYLKEAASHGWNIRYVLLTHFHADFLAGHLELRDRTGAEICLGANASAEYPFRALQDEAIIEMGKIRLSILETPGHTPEGISILVYDLEKDAEKPHAVLTGDTLFIGDVGRPDLMASIGVTADQLASMLYESLHTKLLNLPDETLVYPAHGAGSMCGKSLSTDTVSTMGTQRQYNYALQPMTKDQFIHLVTMDQPEAPQYFSYDAQLNRKERQTLDQAIRKELNPLSLQDILEIQKEPTQVLDVRDPADFAGGHMKGSINIGLGGKFATWAGTILDREVPIIIIAEPGREQEAIRRLGRIGFDHVAGYLDGGMQELESRPDLFKKVTRITAATLAEHLVSENPPQVLDVRTQKERENGKIDGSINIPLPKLSQEFSQVPHEQAVVVHCASGYRSSIGVSLLEHAGFSNVMDLVGGFEAWGKMGSGHGATVSANQTCSV